MIKRLLYIYTGWIIYDVTIRFYIPKMKPEMGGAALTSLLRPLQQYSIPNTSVGQTGPSPCQSKYHTLKCEQIWALINTAFTKYFTPRTVVRNRKQSNLHQNVFWHLNVDMLFFSVQILTFTNANQWKNTCMWHQLFEEIQYLDCVLWYILQITFS